MLTGIYHEKQAVLGSVSYLPSVSMMLPFEPKLTSKSQIEGMLKRALEKVRDELYSSFPRYMVKPALNRLKSILSKLEYGTLKKSIAIFLSPFEEKIYYLN